MAGNFYPAAVKQNIRPGDSDPVIVPVGVVLHTAVSKARSLFGWFNGPSSGIESHFYIRRNGKVEQYRSARREADAQYLGNSWVGPDGVRYGFLSVETYGLGGWSWNKRQLQAIRDLIVWAHEEHGVPYRVVRDMQPPSVDRGGVGYHTQYAGWSNVPGKTCPGPKRIRQFNTELRRWLREQRKPCLHCPTHCP